MRLNKQKENNEKHSGDCVYLLCSNSFCFLSLISLSISLCAERFSLYSFCLLSLISLSFSLSVERFSWSYFFCFLSLISLSVSLSAERFCLLHSLTSSSHLLFSILESYHQSLSFYKEHYRFLPLFHSIKLQECYGFLLLFHSFFYDNNL